MYLLRSEVQIPLRHIGVQRTGEGQAGKGAPVHHRADGGPGPHHTQGRHSASIQGQLHHIGVHLAQYQVDPQGGVPLSPAGQAVPF